MLPEMIKFLFSVLSYVLGLSSIAAFFWYIQFEIDKNAPQFSWLSVIRNTVVFLLFPLQHSILPRPPIKRWLQSKFNPLLERPVYVATSGIAMWFVLWMWKPVGPCLFRLELNILLDAVFYVALLLILWGTIGLDHSSMFGLKQGYCAWKKISFPESRLKTTGIYGMVRHPITSLLVVALWAHESMTMGRLQLNILFTAYALVGTILEETTLIQEMKDEYLDYRERVPAFLPRIWARMNSVRKNGY